MAWKVEYTKKAREQLKKLPRDVSLRITKYMDERVAVRGHGGTYPEARAKLERVKRDFLEKWLNKGLDIPEPETESYLDNTKIYERACGGWRIVDRRKNRRKSKLILL